METKYTINLDDSSLSNPDQFEEFLDALLDAGIKNLTAGEIIKNYGTGIVNLVCLSSKLTETDNPEYGSKIRTQEFNLIFQADDSPRMLISYYANSDGVDEGLPDRFIGYTDSENNSDPSLNAYIDEFISDLQPVQSEEDGE